MGGPRPVSELYLETLPSETSRRTMESALRSLARLVWRGTLPPTEIRWWELTPSDVARLRSALASDGTAPSTGRLRLAALRGVLRECWRAGLMSSDRYHRTVDVRPVPGTRTGRGRIVSRSEVRALFAACKPSAQGQRDRAMLALLFGLGMRRSELVKLEVSDLNLESGRITIEGKGGRQRIEYLTTSGIRIVSQWLAARSANPGPFLNPVVRDQAVTGRPLSAQTIYDSIQRLSRAAGIKRFSPHDARRTFITNLLESGVDIVTIARTVGHASVTTTALYDRRGEDAVRAASRHVRLGTEHTPTS